MNGNIIIILKNTLYGFFQSKYAGTRWGGGGGVQDFKKVGVRLTI